MGEKNRLKAERARFLYKRQRRAEPETEPLLPDLWPVQLTQISRESKGVGPLGRRAGMKVLPEKGRQGAVSGVRRALEGGKAQLFPLQGSRWGKRGVFLNPKAGANGFFNTQPDLS